MKKQILSVLALSIFLSFSAFALDPVGIANFEEATPYLYRGGRPTQSGLADLSKMGVKTVINLQGGDLHSFFGPIDRIIEKGELPQNIIEEGKEVVALDMNYYNFPLDSVNKITDEEGEWINQILVDIANPALQPVFVHCEHGKDRTGLIVALERVEYEHWTPEEARAEWIRMGHGTMNQIITGALDRYFKLVTGY
ncbi:unnamed protein product [Sphagnum jensenii]